MKPGVYRDIDIDAYHGGPGISKSGLDKIAKSPASYYAGYLDPHRPAPKQKAGQLEGELAHCAILEPDEFAKRYAIGPTVHRGTKRWKDFISMLPPNVTPIQQEQADIAWAQSKSVRRIPDVAEALAKGDPETSAYWIDPDTGVLCRCRPDWTHPAGEGVILVDVKTYSDASPREFRRQLARKRYHVQDAFYTDGYTIASGREVLAFLFVVVETEYPYSASCLMLDDHGKERGRDLYRQDLTTFSECQNNNEWPGYSNEIELITLPEWAA